MAGSACGGTRTDFQPISRAVRTDYSNVVVYEAPAASEVVGKAAVKAWVAETFGAYATKWEKTAIRFTVSGDRAFERYTYTVVDTDRKIRRGDP